MPDAFICHASEDKDAVARPVAERLRDAGLDVWYDEFSLRVGDSVREAIDRGLAESRYGVVVVSPAFFQKNWPRQEFDGMFAKEAAGQRAILPIWHDVGHGDVVKQSPLLAARYAARTEDGLDVVVEKLLQVIEPEKSHKADFGAVLSVSPARLRLWAARWTVKSPVRVTNRSTKSVYNVVIKISSLNTKGSSSAIRIDASNLGTDLHGRLGDIVVSPDLRAMDCIDSRGRPSLAVFLSVLAPGETRELIVSGQSGAPEEAEVILWAMSDSPAEVLENEDEMSIPFKIPEPVKVSATRLIMRRSPATGLTDGPRPTAS